MLILINDAVEKKWNRANELLMQKKGGAVEKVAVLEAALDQLLEAIDPVLKAERAAKRKACVKTGSSNKAGIASSPQVSSQRQIGFPARAGNNYRRPLSASLEHQVTLRDGGRCTHRDAQGIRCSSRTFLHFHHIVSVSMGGKDEVRNLTTLCSAHHRFVHRNDRYVRDAKPPTIARRPS